MTDPTTPAINQGEAEILREALRKLIQAADAAAIANNDGSMDEAINGGRKALTAQGREG